MDQGTAIVLAATIPTVIVAVEHYLTRRSVGRVEQQVTTLNESTIGQLAAAAETRRAEDIPHDRRTAQEQRHIDSSPEIGPEQGGGTLDP